VSTWKKITLLGVESLNLEPLMLGAHLESVGACQKLILFYFFNLLQFYFFLSFIVFYLIFYLFYLSLLS